MQVCKAGMTAGQARRIWLTRHGESLYNTLGKIGGDSGLSARGQQYAQLLPEVLESRLPSTDELVSAAAAAAAATSGGDVATAARAAAEAAKAARQAAEEGGPPPVPLSVWTSTLRRTILTAKYLPYPKLRWKALGEMKKRKSFFFCFLGRGRAPVDVLFSSPPRAHTRSPPRQPQKTSPKTKTKDEIHAGTMDSMTYEEIAERFPEDAKARRKDKLRYRYPSGESYLDVVQRLEPVIAEIEREKECVLVVAHQAVLRAVLAYFLGVPLRDLPRIEVPLHTLVELQPRPDGTVGVTRIPVPLPIDAALQGTGGGVASSTGGGTHGGGSAGGEEHAAAAATAAVALTATGAALAATGAGAAAHHPHPLHLSRAGSSSAAAAAAAVGSGSASPADSGDGDGAAALLVGGRGAPAALGVGGVAGPARAPSLSAMLPAPKNLPLGTSPSGSPAAVAAVAAAAADDDANADAAKVAGSERLPSLTFPSTNPLYASGSDGAARFGGKASAAAAAPLPLPVIETGRPRRFSDASGLRGALSSPTAGSATSAAAAAAGAVSPFGGEAGGGRSGGGGAEGGGVATRMMAAIAGAGEADEGGDAAAAALAALALGGSPTDAKGGQPLSGA
jgi:6-phosphofructo-2-kinase/fructose-2,6-biphosphatase